MDDLAKINARKYDGSIHRSWQAKLIEETSAYWLFEGVFDSQVRHSDLGIIEKGTISYEYYFKNAWFNVFRFHQPTGEFRNFYCNLNLPPTFENNILDYVDLDLDILVGKDFQIRLLDEKEFDDNSKKFLYGKETIEGVGRSLKIVLNLIESREFPFNT
jgi:protein associated with RNAse G/E